MDRNRKVNDKATPNKYEIHMVRMRHKSKRKPEIVDKMLREQDSKF